MSRLDDARRAYRADVKRWKKEKKVRTNKFNAEIIQDHLGKHKGSNLELSVLALYRLRERAGEISDLRHQHQVHFTDASIGWRLDFSFVRDGEQWYGEAKGCESESYMIKKKLWRHYGLGSLEIWMGDAQRPYLAETIIPKKP